MNRNQNLVAFSAFLIFCIGIGLKTTDGESDKIDETIAAEVGGTVTLLCHPSLRENSTLSSQAKNFEWKVTGEDIANVPIFSNGKLWPFLFEGDVDNSSFAIDNNPPGTLILRKIVPGDSMFTCTFSTPATKVSYTYFLKTRGRQHYIRSFGTKHQIPMEERGRRVHLYCDAQQVSSPLSDLSFYWLSRKSKPGVDVEDVEVISLNRSILLKNSTKGFQVDEYRTLIVESLSPLWETTFECHLSNGAVDVYSTEMNDYNESTTESGDWTVRNLKKQNFSVVYGTRNVVLPCPPTDNITNSSYIWVFSDPNEFAPSDLLFVDQKKIAYLAKPSPDFYKINDDGSLVILAVKRYQFGKYVCQRSTGEQYVYNVNRENKTIFETISIKGKSTITLPCPLKEQIDRDYNIISWRLKSKNVKIYGGIYVMNGVPERNRDVIIGDNAKLADDKTSLIVSNLTSSSIDDEYYCDLIYSGTTYEYRFTN